MTNVIKSKRSAVQGKIPQNADLALGELAVNTYDGKIYMKKDDGAESIVDLNREAMEWRDLYQQIEYQKNEVVRDGDYTMIANKTTSDRAAPQKMGLPANLLPDAPTWATPSNSVHTYTGLKITPPADRFFQIASFRVWAPSTDPDYTYTVWGIDNSVTPALWEKLYTAVGDKLDLGWNSIPYNGDLFSEGSIFQGILETENSSANTTISGGWTHSSTGNADPDSQAWNTSNNNTTLRIDKTDLDSTDRTTELLSINAGTNVTFVDAAESLRSVEYEVTEDPVDSGSHISYSVTVASTGPNGAPLVGAVCQMTALVPIPGTTSYVTLTDGFLSFPSVQGAISLTGAFVDVTYDNTAYGFDVELQDYTVSEDWDVVAISGGGGASSSGTGGEVGEAPIDGTPYVRQDAIWVDGKTVLNTIDDVVALTPSDGDRLAWDSSSAAWIPKRSQSALGFAQFAYDMLLPPGATPGGADASRDNTDVTLVTMLYINEVDKGSNDNSLFFDELSPGDWINYHLDDNDQVFEQYDISGAPVLVGSVYEVPVIYHAHAGSLSNNNDINVHIRYIAPDTINEAPVDGLPYSRQDAGWTETPITTVFGRVGNVLAVESDYNAFYMPFVETGGYTEATTNLYAVDCSLYNVFFGGGGAMSFINIPNGMYSCTLFITAAAPTWPSGIKWQGGVEPTWSSAGITDIVVMSTVDQGINWYGSASLGYV